MASLSYKADLLINVPNEDVDKIVRREIRKPTYVRHLVLSEDDDYSTIVFIYRIGR